VLEMAMNSVKASVERLGIHFDRWFSERSPYEPGGTFDVVIRIPGSGGLPKCAMARMAANQRWVRIEMKC
jgi:arginyl-tRNA synthetase